MANYRCGTGREKATHRKAAFSNVTLLGFNRILVISDNERTLSSLIERVLSWYSVRENKAHEVVLQDNDQSSRALETPPYTRSARKGCVLRWSTSSPPEARWSACCEEKP